MTGIERIAAERQRQIEKEGWTPEHDDEHTDGELAWAAACYAAPGEIYFCNDQVGEGDVVFRQAWPYSWDEGWDKRPRTVSGRLKRPTKAERLRMLEKAGALIAAEIDRLLRAAGLGEGTEESHG